VIDKLMLIGPRMRGIIVYLAQTHGVRDSRYKRRLDLRRTKLQLPAIVFYRGRRTGVHKLEILGVARLGLSKTQEVIAAVFPGLAEPRIVRVDFCVDFSGEPVCALASSLYAPGAQNVATYKGRGGDTVYVRRSRRKSVLVYDRGKRLPQLCFVSRLWGVSHGIS
jgi:hypothetical protein